MGRQREAQHGQRRGRAAALAQAQAEVEHGLEAEVVQQRAVGGLGRAVAGEQPRAQAGSMPAATAAAAVAMRPSHT